MPVVEHRIPLPANPSPEDILDVLARVYSKPGVRRVVISEDEVHVRVANDSEEPLLVDELLTPEDVVGRVAMEEVEDSGNAHKTLFEMFFRVSTQGLEISHILAGDFRRLRKWLGLPEMVSIGGRLLGVRAQRIESLPDDVLLVVGSPSRTAEIGYASYAVKVSMGVPDA